MKVLDIRSRMLLVALLPVTLISLLLAGVFLLARFDDMQQAYQRNTLMVARQLAAASEFGLFSANQAQLQTVARAVLREPDVRAVTFLDRGGAVLLEMGSEVHTARLAYTASEMHAFDATRRLDWLAQPVFAGDVPLDALYENQQNMPDSYAHPMQLGQVQVLFSRQALDQRQRTMVLIGVGIGVLGLLFGAVLAIYLSRGVLLPIMRVTRQIERIGQGDFSPPLETTLNETRKDPLHELQEQLQRMADQLASKRVDLERQVLLATQALREKKEEAEQANQAKSRFLAAASHDLRQPIHAMGLFISRLAQLPHDAQTGELIRHLESSVSAMQTLLNGLLDISRLDARTMPVNKQAFALDALLRQLRQDWEQAALDKGLRLRIRPTALWVQSDPALLYRIVLNLVDNAVRYTHSGGILVAARLMHGGQQVLLQVWDTGIGIAPEHEHAVFLEFYQVDNVARGSFKGMGLGLNIVQRTANLLDHPLRMASRPGRGSCFSLLLPRAEPPADVSGVSDTPAVDEWHGATVLVIEDDPLVRSGLAGLLRSWGMQVIEARDWHQTQLQLASPRAVDVVISDYRLPEGDNGLDVVHRLRERLGHDLPACLISGDTDATLMQTAQEAGLVLLHKPVRPAKLRSLLRRLLQPQQTSQRLGLDDLV